jgi:hypothetical protein
MRRSRCGVIDAEKRPETEVPGRFVRLPIPFPSPNPDPPGFESPAAGYGRLKSTCGACSEPAGAW